MKINSRVLFDVDHVLDDQVFNTYELLCLIHDGHIKPGSIIRRNEIEYTVIRCNYQKYRGEFYAIFSDTTKEVYRAQEFQFEKLKYRPIVL